MSSVTTCNITFGDVRKQMTVDGTAKGDLTNKWKVTLVLSMTLCPIAIIISYLAILGIGFPCIVGLPLAAKIVTILSSGFITSFWVGISGSRDP